jgi:hypothetical protein
MTSIRRVEASAATQAATGITHFVFDASSGWKAFGHNDAEILTGVVSKEKSGKSVLRLDIHGKHVEITYSIKVDNNSVVIDAVVNGTPSKVAFSKEGGLIGEGFNKTVDPAINEIFRSMHSDLMALRDAPSREGTLRLVVDSNWCGGLSDAIAGARAAKEWLSVYFLTNSYDCWCR